MRLLLVGAFPYPHHQGSQVYFQEQAIALREAGADITLLTYASGRRPEPDGDPDLLRALDGFEQRTSPAWTAPVSLRSGPSWRKPLGDLGLAMTLRDAVASCVTESAYDAILTHNAEAALVALHALPRGRPPIVYCAHTLLGHELSAYPKPLEQKRFSAKPNGSTALDKRSRRLVKRVIDRFGHSLDAHIARRVDAWIVLTQSSARVMRKHSDAPGALLPPALPDPLRQTDRADAASIAELLARHDLEPGAYFVYSGNLDGYQELELLGAAGRELGSGDRQRPRPRIIVASHDPAVLRKGAIPEDLEAHHVASAREALVLLRAARASLIMRRAPGGFPIKLVNSLAVGTPPIAFLDREWGLEDGKNALIPARDRPVSAMAEAIVRLQDDDELARRLSGGARALYQAQHSPERAASRVHSLLEAVQRSRRG